MDIFSPSELNVSSVMAPGKSEVKKWGEKLKQQKQEIESGFDEERALEVFTPKKKYGIGKNKKLMGIEGAKKLQFQRKFSRTATMNDLDDEMMQDVKLTTKDAMGFTAVSDGLDEDATDFRSNFMEQYGVDIQFPSFYSSHGVLVPHKKNMIVSTGFHTIPRIDDQVVQVTEYDEKAKGKVYDSNFSSMYDMVGSSIILKLMEAKEREGFHTHCSV